MRRFVYRLNPYLWSRRVTAGVFALFLMCAVPLYAAYGVATVNITDAYSGERSLAKLAPVEALTLREIDVPVVDFKVMNRGGDGAGVDLPAIRIPRIALDSPIVEVGFKAGTNQPDTPDDGVGRFNLTADLGADGNTFLFGHAPGVFGKLHVLAVGDEIVIAVGAGDISYRVIAVEVAPLSDARMMTRALRAHPLAGALDTLSLMTCAGEYDAGLATYSSRLIVYAERV